ncbi:MAG: hypothetical protein HY286_07900 [Planctomycetes bacterium]|nr:hypothetical protein [Planctomycetota bacterium]
MLRTNALSAKLTLLIIAAVAALAAVVLAHDFFGPGPNGKERPIFKNHSSIGVKDTIVIPLNGTAKLRVKDPGTCKANLTAVLTSGNFCTISADPSVPVEEFTYTITGNAIGNTTLNVHVTGTGTDKNGSPCNENLDNFFRVAVVDSANLDKKLKAAEKKAQKRIKDEMKNSIAQFNSSLKTIETNFTSGTTNGFNTFLATNTLRNNTIGELHNTCTDVLINDFLPTMDLACTDAGFTLPEIPLPPGLQMNDCSTVGKLNTLCISNSILSANSMNAPLKKLNTTLQKGGVFINNSTLTIPNTVFSGPTGTPFASDPAATAQKPLVITSADGFFEPNFNIRAMEVRGRADANTGGTVNITIVGPANAQGVPAYVLSTSAPVAQDCTFDAVFQDSAIVAGNALVGVTHGTEGASTTIAVP